MLLSKALHSCHAKQCSPIIYVIYALGCCPSVVQTLGRLESHPLPHQTSTIRDMNMDKPKVLSPGCCFEQVPPVTWGGAFVTSKFTGHICLVCATFILMLLSKALHSCHAKQCPPLIYVIYALGCCPSVVQTLWKLESHSLPHQTSTIRAMNMNKPKVLSPGCCFEQVSPVTWGGAFVTYKCTGHFFLVCATFILMLLSMALHSCHAKQCSPHQPSASW